LDYFARSLRMVDRNTDLPEGKQIYTDQS